MITIDKKIVKHYIELHKMLQGEGATVEDIAKDLSGSFDLDYDECLEKVMQEISNIPNTNFSKKKFGLINGRFQPFHKGHQEIINEILLEDLIPIIVLGSSNKKRDLNKNPLTYAQRKELIRLVYPNIPIVFVRGVDYENWDIWYEELIHLVGKTLSNEFDRDTNKRLQDDLIIFHNDKEVDKTSFMFNNKKYENTWYTKIFEDDGFETKEVNFVSRDDIKIDSNARDIRENLEGLKHLLDSRIYFRLKQWGW